MGTPNVIGLSPVAGNHAQSKSVAIADNIVVRDGVYRIAIVPLAVDFGKEGDLTISTGTVMNDNIAPSLLPVSTSKPKGAQCYK